MSNNNAREKFIALVKSNGWVLDPTSTVWSRYSAEGKKQDPWSYVRLAADGTGKWRIKLDSENVQHLARPALLQPQAPAVSNEGE